MGSESQSVEAAPEEPASGSQSAPAAPYEYGEGPRPSRNKENAVFNAEEDHPLYKTALMTATAEQLRSSVGQGLTRAEVPEPTTAKWGRGFQLLVTRHDEDSRKYPRQ